MPIITLANGQTVFIESDDPEEIKKASKKFIKRKSKKSDSVVGDIGLSLIHI